MVIISVNKELSYNRDSAQYARRNPQPKSII